ncbi:RNA polymerase sigma factor [Desulfitobacterium chlororespirans]|uniref:RNA polymerase sigma-70 factor, ECF subfamily n=1 Tax=Desulfitobacterium chlororespirans DSM 11544 TaxID=1121395 RepID=A0A1M7U722_9FIRM|nr:RNA polymerase sigma factor [Desulfitobacterium chlororespirans]SHN78758.1 RNA polymerase sigma-70 factor, ECF subfamily [Desulfitobacterium chlororespirans DSM 11544]
MNKLIQAERLAKAETIGKGRSQNKLERLYSLYNKDMFYVAYSRLKDYQLAQDAVHTSFIKIADRVDTIDEKDRAYILSIAKNTAIDIGRKRSRRDSSLDEIENLVGDEAVSIEDDIINREMFDILLKKIDELPNAYGDLILLKYIYALSDQELAEMLGISPENVRMRISRARKKLKEMLTEGKEASDHE